MPDERIQALDPPLHGMVDQDALLSGPGDSAACVRVVEQVACPLDAILCPAVRDDLGIGGEEIGQIAPPIGQ